jgi:hypothetical protein
LLLSCPLVQFLLTPVVFACFLFGFIYSLTS